MHSAAPFKRGKKPLIKPKRACTFCARPLKILHSKIPCLPAAQRTETRRVLRQDESQRELILIQLDLAENMPDVALPGILRLIKKIMVKRYGNPKEVAYLVKFLISDEADFINNTIIRIDGGQPGSC